MNSAYSGRPCLSSHSAYANRGASSRGALWIAPSNRVSSGANGFSAISVSSELRLPVHLLVNLIRHRLFVHQDVVLHKRIDVTAVSNRRTPGIDTGLPRLRERPLAEHLRGQHRPVQMRLAVVGEEGFDPI